MIDSMKENGVPCIHPRSNDDGGTWQKNDSTMAMRHPMMVFIRRCRPFGARSIRSRPNGPNMHLEEVFCSEQQDHPTNPPPPSTNHPLLRVPRRAVVHRSNGQDESPLASRGSIDPIKPQPLRVRMAHGDPRRSPSAVNGSFDEEPSSPCLVPTPVHAKCIGGITPSRQGPHPGTFWRGSKHRLLQISMEQQPHHGNRNINDPGCWK